jgi:hypothetical protein
VKQVGEGQCRLHPNITQVGELSEGSSATEWEKGSADHTLTISPSLRWVSSQGGMA